MAQGGPHLNSAPPSRYGRRVGLGLALLALVLVVVVLLLPRGPRDPMEVDEPHGRSRDAVRAKKAIVVAGTPEAAHAMRDVLAEGGNAVDAAVAGLLVLNVTFGDAASFPGIAPVLVWDAAKREVQSYVGAGTAPARATIETYRERGQDEFVQPLSIDAQLIPASPDVVVALLRRYGTRDFSSLAASAIRHAEDGFPVHPTTVENVGFGLPMRLGLHLWRPQTSLALYEGRWWRPLVAGDRRRRPGLAKTFRALAAAERDCLGSGGSRDRCLVAVRDVFYRGSIADAIVALHEERDGLFTREDLADYAGRFETPLRGRFQDYEVLTNGTWTQGIVVPMALQILDGIPLEELEHNSPAYLHTIVQALELAMADREAYVGDADFVDVPLSRLLDRDYAASRRAEMTERAFGALPAPGDAARSHSRSPLPAPSRARGLLANLTRIRRDTSYLAVIDAQGNSVSMTPSDFPVSPLVPDWGLTLGIRMTQFRLDPSSPTALEPGKRPRVTPHALMLLRDGQHVMSIGTPGGEMQTQANLQVLLNHLVFGMDIQQAIEAPRVRCLTWPDSFAPHDAEPGVIELEGRLHDAVAEKLTAYGYEVRRRDDGDHILSAVGAVHHEDGMLVGGADPRESTLALGL